MDNKMLDNGILTKDYISSQAEYKKRVEELQFFIKSHPDELSYDEILAKHLLSKITIFDDHIVFEFKSGVTVSVEK